MQSAKAISFGKLSALRRHFEVSLYLLLLTSVLTVVSTGKLDLISILVPPAALGVKGLRWFRGKGPEISARLAAWLTIAYFAFFPLDLWVVSRTLASDAQNPALYAALLASIHLLLYAMIVRLFSASTTRDYLFLTLLAFTCMLASAILTVDTMFLIFFVVFLMLCVSTFVGLEMLRSAEGAVTPPLEQGTPAARRLHGALGATAGMVAFGAIALGAIIFFFIPRFSTGYFSSFNLQPTLISGFSDDVELGQIGEIKKSGALVMRVKVEGGLEIARGTHWRGIALTTFDGKRWYNEAHESLTVTPDGAGWFGLWRGDIARRGLDTPMRYTVLLEPVATSSLFLANEVERLRGKFAGDLTTSRAQRRVYLLVDQNRAVFNPFRNYERLEYEAVSLIPAVSPAALRSASTDYSEAIREMYLQLPSLDSRIPDLARQITARAATPYDKAAAMEGYLRSHYGYTLDLSGTPPTDPLAYFLFQKRAGHCEYFASAMTVMLRTLGIPARYVNGFQTGEYNDVGGDFVVRASDAHSWVEVYFPDFGWMTFDPTPASDVKPSGFLARAGNYWDWFELKWSEWVINYDVAHQFTLAQNLQRTGRGWGDMLTSGFNAARANATRRMREWQSEMADTSVLFPVILGTLVAISILLLQPRLRHWFVRVLRIRLATSATLTPSLATLHYREMLRLLARRGLRKSPAQTPLEFVASVPDEALAARVSELTSLYQAARYGGAPADSRQIGALLARVKDAARAR